MTPMDDGTGGGRDLGTGRRWPEHSRGEGEVDLGTGLATPVREPLPIPTGLMSTAKPDFYSTRDPGERPVAERPWAPFGDGGPTDPGTGSLDTLPMGVGPTGDGRTGTAPTGSGRPGSAPGAGRDGEGFVPATGPLPFEFDGLSGNVPVEGIPGTGGFQVPAVARPSGPFPPFPSPDPDPGGGSFFGPEGGTPSTDGLPTGESPRLPSVPVPPVPAVDLTRSERALPAVSEGSRSPSPAGDPGSRPARRPAHGVPAIEPPTAQLTAVPACLRPPEVLFDQPRPSLVAGAGQLPVARDLPRTVPPVRPAPPAVRDPATQDPDPVPEDDPVHVSRDTPLRSGRRRARTQRVIAGNEQGGTGHGRVGTEVPVGAEPAGGAGDGARDDDRRTAGSPRPSPPRGGSPDARPDRRAGDPLPRPPSGAPQRDRPDATVPDTGSGTRPSPVRHPDGGPAAASAAAPTDGGRREPVRARPGSRGAVVAFPHATVPVWRTADGRRAGSSRESPWFGTSLGRLGGPAPSVLQSVLDAVQVGVVVRDPAGATLLTNERGRNLLEPHAGARHPIDVAISNASVHDSAGDVEVVVSTVADVSTERRRERALLLSENRFRAMMEHSPAGFAVLSADGRILEANESLCRLLGRRASELGGRVLSDLSYPGDVERDAGPVAGVLSGARESCTVERRFLRPSGETVWGLMSLAAVRDHDRRLCGIVAQVQDVTEGRTAAQLLDHATLHDPLTGLANRVLGLDRIGKALDRCRRSGRHVAVLCCGVDRFKVVNDSIGHACGDAVLVELARRLEQALRGSDTAARIAGDEFAVVCEDVQDSREAVLVAERMLAAVREPVSVEGRTVVLTMSVGIAVSSQGCDDPTALMRDAGTALHRAKENGRSCWYVADDALRRRATDRLEIEQALRAGIAGGDLRLFFQPIVDLQTGQPVGHEALVRWQHPRRGLLGPGSFLAVAEETGLVRDIGRWVLTQAARSTALTPGNGYVAVNVSPSQVRRPGLLAEIESVLERTGLPASRLVVELTETVMLGAAPAGRTELHRLDALGVRLVVDDFGTGFSALSYLRDLPVSGIKVDRSFTAGLGSDPQCDRIVEALTGLAHGLGVDLVAEGVETEQQRAFLCRIGCRHAQGYLFGKPLPRAV